MKKIITAVVIGLSLTLGLGILVTGLGGFFYVVGSLFEIFFGSNAGIAASLFTSVFLVCSTLCYTVLLKGK